MTRRFEHLDGLRGVASFIVIIYHGLLAFDLALLTGAPGNSVTPWDIWLSGAPFLIPMAGNFAVCLFFALSGFVLVGAFDSTPMGLIPLLAKRYVRLALPVTCACLFACLLLSAGLMANHEVSAITRSTWWLGRQYGQSASFINAFQEGSWDTFTRTSDISKTYDSSLWTMQIEFVGSAGILLVCCLAKRLAPESSARRVVYIASFAAFYGAFAESYVGLFAAGALIRQIFSNGWRPLTSRPCLALAICTFGIFCGTIPFSQAIWPMFRIFPNPGALNWMPWAATGPVFWHTVGAIVMLVGLQSSPLMQTVLKTPICRWLGSISYPLYLIHIPILMTLGCHVFLAGNEIGAPHKLSVILALVTFVAVSLICAHAFMLAVERPAIWFSGRVARKIPSAMASITQATVS
ncbi:MAG TPA: acyltransferase [Acidocella sp.]|jgi:peptidoglycan/LPS O-acetylase OafA/YrhL|uniref:acyltransferase family protein n=1 Tax=Acidocella sp. TaxID=50710 RepID=UPI002C80124D|nr:acyltransferase [Acidocella sp.]HVE23256.1 acyltransferase [Acidocella sp.]